MYVSNPCYGLCTYRYDLCLQNGMNPGLVLSEEQKKKRFRKMLKKKKKRAAIEQIKRFRVVTTASSAADGDGDQLCYSPQVLTRDLNFIEQRVLDIHLGHAPPTSLTSPEVAQLGVVTMEKFLAIASSDDDFMTLGWDDRSLLIFQNSCIFRAFMLVRYLAADTPAAQVSCLIDVINERQIRETNVVVTVDDVAAVVRGFLPAAESEWRLLAALRGMVATCVRQWRNLQNVSVVDFARLILFWERDNLGCKNKAHSESVRTRQQEALGEDRYRATTALFQDLWRLAQLTRVLQLRVSTANFSSITEQSLMESSSLLQFLERRSRCLARTLAMAHEERLDSISNLAAAGVHKISALLMSRLHISSTLQEQLRLLGVIISSAAPPTPIFRLQTKKPFQKKSLARLQTHLELLRSFFSRVGDDVFFAFLLVVFFSPPKGSSHFYDVATSDAVVVRHLRGGYLAALEESLVGADEDGNGGELLELAATCLALTDELAELAPNFIASGGANGSTGGGS